MPLSSNRFVTGAALAMAVALCGCGGLDFDNTATWFAKPIDVFGSRAGYTYSNLGDARQDRPITANDLVDANGACPAAAPPPPPPQAAGGNPASPDMAALLGGGVAIGMSECEVVTRLGQPTAVNLGRNPNGDRNAILTYRSGTRPGVYRFDGGRLTEMDRVEEVAPLAPTEPVKKSEPAKKKVAKKKPPPPPPPANAANKT